MKLALRLLVFVLVMAASGIVQPLACASVADAECSDCEPAHGQCSDCMADCGLCIACPLTAAPSSTTVAPVAGIVLAGPVSACLSGRPANAHPIAIFLPPQA